MWRFLGSYLVYLGKDEIMKSINNEFRVHFVRHPAQYSCQVYIIGRFGVHRYFGKIRLGMRAKPVSSDSCCYYQIKASSIFNWEPSTKCRVRYRLPRTLTRGCCRSARTSNSPRLRANVCSQWGLRTEQFTNSHETCDFQAVRSASA